MMTSTSTAVNGGQKSKNMAIIRSGREKWPPIRRRSREKMFADHMSVVVGPHPNRLELRADDRAAMRDCRAQTFFVVSHEKLDFDDGYFF